MILEDLSVLIIVYRRFENLEEIIKSCIKNATTNIYIAIDFPKNGDLEGIKDFREVIKVIKNHEEILGLKLRVWIRRENLGCAVSVLTACDWFFKQVDFGIVLEDDCLPSDDFFNFAIQVKSILNSNENVWLACGTQYAPIELFEDSWVLSNYPLNWGWVTNKDKWLAISSAIKNSRKKLNILNRQNRKIRDSVYWNAGAMRAYRSQVDVWDTILVQKMLAFRKLAVLPSVALVTNNGNDSIATNVNLKSSWTNLQTFEFRKPINQPLYSNKVTNWVRNNFFRISFRHIFSTRINYLLDSTIRKINKGDDLLSRWAAVKMPEL